MAGTVLIIIDLHPGYILICRVYSSISVVRCGVPGSLLFASVLNNDTSYGSLVVYKCDTGYIFDDTRNKTKNVTCNEHGLWEVPNNETLQCIGKIVDQKF